MCTGVVVGLSVALAGVGVCSSCSRSFLFFFFSSRRRHTRCLSDWSSDVCSSDLGPAFTHISYDDYRIVAGNLLEGGTRTTADRLVPYVVFIDPQLGRVGLSEAQDRKSVV